MLTVEGEGRRLRRLFDAPLPVVVRREPRPAAVHQTMQTQVAPVAAAASPAGDLTAQARDFLRRQFAPILKIAPAQIDIDEALENYGISSI
ncbi:hypothetical protein AB4084_34015, partial [Lysobacter sp. 2RAB21]